MSMKFILTGANAGKSKTINHVKFVDGKAEVAGPIEKMGGLIALLATYSAYPVGSDALLKAIKFDKENNIGTSQILPRPAGSAASGLQADGTTSGETGGELPTGTEADGSGSGAEGGGVQAGRVGGGEQTPETLKVIDALKSLNPDVADQWTDEGLPAVAVVAEISGVPTVSRKDIETVLPGWNKAKAAAEANEF